MTELEESRSAGRWQDTAPARRRRFARWIPLLAGLVVVAGVGLAISTRLVNPATGPELELRGRLAVLPLVNATGDPAQDWVSLGLVEMVTETLERTPGVRVVPPERLRRALELRGLDPGDQGSRQRIRELAAALGGEVILDASLRKRGRGLLGSATDEVYTLEFRFFDAGGELGRGELEGPDPLSVADRLAYSAARGLASGSEPARMTAVFARDLFVDRLYAMGLQELRLAGAAMAVPYFEIALRSRPRFLQARARLADCRQQLGDMAASRELGFTVLEEAQARGERRWQVWSLQSLGRLAALEGRFDEAQEHYSRAFSILLAADAPAVRADLLYELARLSLIRGENGRAEEHFLEILELRQSLGDRLGEADTLLELGSLFLGGGDLEGAKQSLLRSRKLALGLEDPWTEMRAVASLGEVARREGDVATASDLWRQALAFYEQRGDRPRQLLLTRNLADALLSDKRFDQAEELLYEVVDIASELDNQSFEASASLRLAWLLLRTGYPLQARTHLDRTLELDRFLNDDRLDLQQVIAWFAYEQGNYQLAVDTQRQAKRQSKESWSSWHEAFLRVFEEALLVGRRLPVPGEEGYRPLAPATD